MHHTQKKNFFDALEVCHQDGATLAEYQTVDEYAAIEHYQGKSNINHHVTSSMKFDFYLPF